MSNESSSRKAYLILFFLTLLNIVNFIDRYFIVGFSNEIKADLGMTNLQYSYLTGIIFTIFYSTVGVGLGVLADRWNRPRIIAIGLFVWSIMTAASGLAKNFGQMAIPRLLIGAGEATLTPTALSLLSDTFPPKKRSMATGIYYIGVPFGTGLAFVLAGILGPIYGWRNCFYGMGAIGVLLTLAVLLIKDPPRGTMEEGHKEKGGVQAHDSFGKVLLELFHAFRVSPALWLVIVGAILTHVSLGATLMDNLWLVNDRGFAPKDAATLVGKYLLIAGTIGTFVGGIGADWFQARWPKGGKLYFLALMQTLAIPFIVLFRFTEDTTSTVFTVSLLIVFLTNFYFYGPVYSAVQELAPVRVRATAVALLLFLVNFFGLSVGASIAGGLADKFIAEGMAQPYTWANFTPNAIGFTCIVFYLLAAFYYDSSRKRILAAEMSGEFGPAA